MAASHSLSSSAETLRAEAAWHRSVAERIESLANEIQPLSELRGEELRVERDPAAKEVAIIPEIIPPIAPVNGHHAEPALVVKPIQEPPMEFAGLTQKDAILKALRTYGPQNASELFERLTQGGMMGVKRQHLAVAICNTKRKRGILRDDDGKYRILDVLSK